MMAGLEMRGAEAAARAAGDIGARLADALAMALPDVRVSREGDAIVIEGHGLARRQLREPALRWPTGLLP